MSERGKRIIIAVLAFLTGSVTGGIAGGYVAIYFTTMFFADGYVLGNGTEIQANVAILRHLRDGQPAEATELIEAMLDSKIVGLQTKEMYSESTGKVVQKAIQQAKEYRAQYPRQTKYPELDETVTRILGQNGE